MNHRHLAVQSCLQIAGILRTHRAGALAGGVLLTIAATGRAQDLTALREQLRSDLRNLQFAQSMLGLVMLSDELELSGARYAIDDDVSTDLKVYTLPMHRTLAVFGANAPQLHLEGSLGYATARQGTADLFGGTTPSLQTAVDTTWRTYGGLVGAGLRVPVRESLSVTPIVDVGLSHLSNHADYSGPGAAASAGLLDGIALNWDALALAYGTALRADWRHDLDAARRLEVGLRYDARWTETLEADDPAQEFRSRAQVVTLRGDLFGPTGLQLASRPIDWQAGAAYRRFTEGSLFGVNGYLQVGGSLLLRTGDSLPFGNGLSLSAAGMIGENLLGWTVSLGLAF